MAQIRLAVEQGRTLKITYYGFHTSNIVAKNQGLAEALGAFDMVVPDGIAILWSAWLFGLKFGVENRMNGDILAPFLYTESICHGWGIYFLGGAAGVAELAAERIRETFPGVKIVGIHDGYIADEAKAWEIAHEIDESGAAIVLVGQGQPIQEEWIISFGSSMRTATLIGVGGYFDHVVRRIDCYPLIVYKLRLNWAYRVFKEPRRLWRRYTIGITQFGIRLACAVLRRWILV